MMRPVVSGVMSRKASNDSTPALVTRISTGPSSARTRVNAAATEARSATSGTATALPPPAASSAAAASAPAVPVEYGHVMAVGDEAAGHAEPDAGGCAGDGGDPAHAGSEA